MAASAAPAAPRQKGTVHGALHLALSAVLVGMGNYGLSLFLVNRLPAPDFTVYAAVPSVLLSVDTLAGATVPWVLAREVADSVPGSTRRRLAVRTCLWPALGLSFLTAVAACKAVASYAGPGPLAGLAATLERLRVDRQLEEAMVQGPDPLHFAEVFGLHEKAAMRYADSARVLLEQAAETGPAGWPRTHGPIPQNQGTAPSGSRAGGTCWEAGHATWRIP
ncbi:hypothetical protein [Streptomyces sp. ME19-01-6]|uniref:hypothetical protein n=1 Tax=Streptomyces sp. ME19-01-6 TaxID=3028686 RepID=UPI0029AE5B04|nr:hypothetical protein [Streptomyces sp. ME19-01-6]MDX3230457.1 hypothetical protein [Streptomyces sp. ME19-01-6]